MILRRNSEMDMTLMGAVLAACAVLFWNNKGKNAYEPRSSWRRNTLV